MILPYPPCPVPDEINPSHNGGGEIGPLYAASTDSALGYGYACAACCQALGTSRGGEISWPPGDGTGDFC